MEAPMTEFVFRAQSYLKTLDALVTEVTPDGGIVLDRTIFYANSGGQPGDSGALTAADGAKITVATAVHPEGDKTRIVHVPAPDQPSVAVGQPVRVEIDWDRRYRLMR